MSVLNAGIHEILARIANQEDPGLIWVCPVCLDVLAGNLKIYIQAHK